LRARRQFIPQVVSMKTNEEIRATVEGAFSPLRCVAEVWDYEKKLRFRVFDAKDEAVVTFPNEVIGNLRDESALKTLIQTARSRTEGKGHKLDPWPK
jgi:hypothetical protein